MVETLSPLLLPDWPASVVPSPPRIAVVVSGPAASMPLCLLALQRQRTAAGLRPSAGGIAVVLAPEEGPARLRPLLAGIEPHLPFPLRIEATPGAEPGWRAALRQAADWVGPEGMVLSTRADAAPEPGWIAAHAAAIAAGAEAGAGIIRPPSLPCPARRYALLLEAIAARLDPLAEHLPPPAEAAHNLAFRAGILPDALPPGGAPALLALLRARDATIRLVAGAVVGAALPPPPVEGLRAACRRVTARAMLRRLWEDGIGIVLPENEALRHLARRLGLPAGALAALLGTRHFGAAWAAVEAASSMLALQPLPATALAGETRRARLLLAWLRLAGQRAGGRPAGAAMPGGSCIGW
ncbi:hypothetical protein JMJ55_12060 [Belnapia sp. T6]|uniref:Glycosyltransferase n=1 Tax=Belnapia mucosa TaxID=2804532 RepID=A0ABS1V2Y7_9PROT|nr:hypothetical protein [Belnapia mucosa]MBL6456061.1 hypothetical protein [Belnapia mucosa]